MSEASRRLDEILKGSKPKRRALKGYYYKEAGEIHYLLYDASKEKFYATLRDPQGRLHKQKEAIPTGNPLPTAQWGNGHTHIQFPRPKEYTLGEIGSPLDRISVKQLTQEFSKNRRTPPSAPAEWEKRMKAINQPPPDWAIVADRYANRFLTPCDAATHFKHITHRALFTRKRIPNTAKNARLCRLCHKALESSTHIGQCKVTQTLFCRINRLEATPKRICSTLRQHNSPSTAVMEILFVAPHADIPLSIGSLLTILWKYALISWYKVDTEQKSFIKDTVWGQAIRRFAELCLVQLAKYRKAQARALARGSHEPITKYNAEMEPLASIQRDGTLRFSTQLIKELEDANGLSYIQKTSSTNANKREWIKFIKPSTNNS